MRRTLHPEILLYGLMQIGLDRIDKAVLVVLGVEFDRRCLRSRGDVIGDIHDVSAEAVAIPTYLPEVEYRRVSGQNHSPCTGLFVRWASRTLSSCSTTTSTQYSGIARMNDAG